MKKVPLKPCGRACVKRGIEEEAAELLARPQNFTPTVTAPTLIGGGEVEKLQSSPAI